MNLYLHAVKACSVGMIKQEHKQNKIGNIFLIFAKCLLALFKIFLLMSLITCLFENFVNVES